MMLTLRINWVLVWTIAVTVITLLAMLVTKVA